MDDNYRNIVDYRYMFSKLAEKFDDHNTSFKCKFGDLRVYKDRQWGLKKQIFFKCTRCNYFDSIFTEEGNKQTMGINKAAVSATYASGTGLDILNQILSSMGIKTLKAPVHNKHDYEIIEAIANTAEAEMATSAARAREQAIKDGHYVMHNGEKIGIITVKGDRSWGHRSYRGGKYDSPCGLAIITDSKSGDVLDIGVENKNCSMCSHHARVGTRHRYFRTYDKDEPSSGMEKKIIVNIFNRSVGKHKLICKTFIGNGDSSARCCEMMKKGTKFVLHSNFKEKKFFFFSIDSISHLLS